MFLSYSAIFLIFAAGLLYSLWSSNSEAKIKYM